MAATSMTPLLRRLRSFAAETGAPNVSDAELLERFIEHRDEIAFELLVWRHQRLVLGVCRRVLGNAHDAEDAFQAVFLALVRKAHCVSRRAAIAGWLYTVAYRVALRARARTAKRSTATIDLDSIGSGQNSPRMQQPP